MPSRPALRWLCLLPLVAAFGVAVWQMRYDWTYDETYHYGWTVLPLALYLFSLRWRDRPVPGEPVPEQFLRAGWILLAGAYPLAWLAREANPEWRLLGVIFAVLAVFTALLYLLAAGGRRWARHFTGPVLFFLTAIPWPSLLEKAAAALLMPANAAIALEVLHWLQIPAIRSGHLITLPGGTLGVEEACSGIRSLQSTLMMACFLGELYHLGRSTRAILLLCGMAFALFTNALRTIGLSTLAARSGLAATHAWHDPAGLLALGANVLCLFLLTAWFVRQRKSAPVLRTVSPVQAPPHTSAFPLSRSPLILATGLILMFPLTAWWYGRHESRPTPLWHLDPPRTAPAFREVGGRRSAVSGQRSAVSGWRTNAAGGEAFEAQTARDRSGLRQALGWGRAPKSPSGVSESTSCKDWAEGPQVRTNGDGVNRLRQTQDEFGLEARKSREGSDRFWTLASEG